MNLIPWHPFRELESLGRDFFAANPFFGGLATPRVDVLQTETEVIVKAEIPGVSKEDLNVYIEDSVLRLSGQAKKDSEFKDEHVYRTERYYGSFSRTVPLPVEVKSEQAQADYQNGILTIRIPKVEPARMKGRRIDIH
ncbi:MAG TPA: Hsp20/alpha crystallin family protein [Firmicutes bacterium]|jgi:HSP20 family protein|nr:Hsp20/alpha crystallin family protein [Bacillota bacterium]